MVKAGLFKQIYNSHTLNDKSAVFSSAEHLSLLAHHSKLNALDGPDYRLMETQASLQQVR